MVRTMLARAMASAVVTLAVAAPVLADGPFRKIGEMELAVRGISAVLEPAAPVVPRNIPSGVRVVVRAGGQELSAEQVRAFLGLAAGETFQVAGELSGPGLGQTITLPAAGTAVTDPLLLPYPGLAVAGDYHLSGARITVNGQTRMDVSPDDLVIRVIDQILVTSVRTRPLTLDEIRARGIVLDADDYLGYEFTLGLKLESEPIAINFPVVFDRRGVPLPQPLVPPPSLPRAGVGVPAPLIVPMLLARTGGAEDDDPSDDPPLTLPNGQPIRIPALLVIPGEVGYLKQFFSAQLFVANGAPVGSGLTLHQVTGTLQLPPGDDGAVGTEDDPLALPELPNGTQPLTMPVRAVGPDGETGTPDDVDELAPGDQGMADFTVRGEEEGFHPIGFDIDAELLGLPTGPVHVTGQARGGVLVRNPYLDMTFALPSVVRADEEFDLFVTITNVGQVPANLVSMDFIEGELSNLELLSSDFELIPTLQPRTSRTFRYRFLSRATGQVVASYLKFQVAGGGHIPPGAPVPGGTLRFTLGVGERGVALSPDTLVLPSAVDALPADVVRAAMRVLGQAWSVARAPNLPPDVLRIEAQVVRDQALSLAEAGLRRQLGQALASTLRDYAFDLHAQDARDPGFDQLLRQTEAGRALDAVLGSRLASSGGGASAVLFERDLGEVAASGADFVSFGVGGGGGLDADVLIRDASGRTSVGGNAAPQDVPGAALLSLGDPAGASVVGFVGAPLDRRYVIEIAGRASGTAPLSVTLPRGDGTFLHAEAAGLALAPGSRTRVTVDLDTSETIRAETDLDGDGVFEQQSQLASHALTIGGPRLQAAAVIGPETLNGASPFGDMAALLFDRSVDAASASDLGHYSVPQNSLEFAKRFLSGRIVMAILAQPEGPYVPTTVTAQDVADTRGHVGPLATVDLSSQLVDDGAVVTGRVMEASGTPLASLPVTYENVLCDPLVGIAVPKGIAIARTDANGYYQFRYVRQDPCGQPFRMNARDPITQALRTANGWVRAAGELVNLDLVFLGYGNVTGTVRRLSGEPAPGAAVRVVSVVDPQVGAVATADAQGRYAVSQITVGSVVVDAASGLLLGHAAGHIPIAGGTAVVDVTLDGTANVSGTVTRVVTGGASTPAAGAQVVFTSIDGQDGTVTGVTSTDTFGRYSFEGMPAGQFSVAASLASNESGSASGTLVPGQTLAGVNVAIVVASPDAQGTVRGTVRSAQGTPVPGAYVNVGARGALAGADGAYRIEGVPVLPFQPQTVFAQAPDGLRYGSAQFQVNAPGAVVSGVDIRLSGLGSVEFTVLGPDGQPVANQEVRLGGVCLNPCGCEPKVTNGQGRVRWDGRAMGGVSAQAVRTYPSYIDVATAQTTLTQDGQLATATLRFAGVGRVGGIVFDPGGVQPAHGADVTVVGRKYFNDGEQVCGMLSDQVIGVTRTDQQGRFEVPNVAVGGVKVTASSFVYPTLVGTQTALTAHGELKTVSLTLTDTLAGKLTGRVFLPDGVTPSGAGVTVALSGPLPEVEVRTDAEGRYSFARILPAGHYTAVVRDNATGGVAESRIYLPASLDAVRDFRLKYRGPVTVRVVTAGGQPAASGTVRLTELEYPRRVLAGSIAEGSGGLVTFAGIFEGPIVAEASNTFAQGGRAYAERPPSTDPFEVRVTLGATGTVRGHFVMPDGTTPIPFGVVRLVASGVVIGQVTTAGSGDVGSFQFEHVPAGAVRVDAQDPLTARTGVATGDLALDQVLDLTVRAQGIGRVVGLVTDNGAPAAGASVEVRSGPSLAATSTDGSGRYVVEGVPEGQVVVSASYDGGFLRGTRSGLLSGDGQTLTLDVALQDSGAIRGLLLKAGGAEPAPVSTVSASAGAYYRTAVSNEDGTFAFSPVPAGNVNLAAAVAGGIDLARGTALVPAAGEVDVTLTLNGVGSLSGETRSTGGPIAGRLVLVGTGAFPWQKVIYTANDGQFALPELLAGPFTAQLQAQVGGFPLYGSATGVVQPGANTHLVVSLQPSGTVVGRVRRADGVTPAASANVVVQAQNGAAAGVTTGPDGSFVAAGVPVGTATVRVQDPTTGGVARVVDVIVTEGATTDVGEIVLDDTPVAVLSVVPSDGTAGVGLAQAVTLAFSDPLASATGISVRKGAVAQPTTATLSADRRTVTLTPQVALPDASELTVEATTAVTDVYGRTLAETFRSRFFTVDLSAPRVTAVVPANGAIQVAATSAVTVTFDEPLAAGTPFATLVRLQAPSGPVAGTSASAGANGATFTPDAPLPLDTAYTVTVNGAVDASGNTQTTPFTSSFKTVDTIPPVLTLAQPAAGSWVAVLRPAVTVGVEDGAGSGADPATAVLRLDGVPVTATASATTIVHSPSADLAQGLHAVTAQVADRGGNVGLLASTSFGVDTVAPAAAAVTGPAAGQVVSGTVAFGGTAVDPGGAAASGVARIDLFRDGVMFLQLAPPFSQPFNTAALSEGPHALTARAVDVAGNVGPTGAPMPVIVNNVVLSMAITSPAANTPFRDAVTVTAIVSEPVDRIEFAVGAATVTDAVAPYTALLDLAPVPEGPATVTATAFAPDGTSASATLTIVVDRTPPAAPDVSRITAERKDAGFAQVVGAAGAVEAQARVEVTNPGTGAQAAATAAGNGSFVANLLAALGTELSVVAVDRAGNRSAPTLVTVADAEDEDGVPLQGLQLWVDATGSMTSDAAGVSVWPDRSPNHNDLLQTDASRRPARIEDGVSNLPVVRFDGSNDSMRFTARLTNVRTVVWLVKESEAATSAYRSLLGDDQTTPFAGQVGAPGSLFRLGDASNAVILGQTRVNGVAVDGTVATRPRTLSTVSVVTTGPVAASKFGEGFLSPWWGDLAEMLVYDRPLTVGEVQAVEDYLVRKYRPFVPATGTPAILPAGGAFTGSTVVRLESSTPGAAIHYTLDGSSPTPASSLYEAPFAIDETTTVRARAFRPGFDDSAVAIATFVRADQSPVVTADGLALWLRADAGIATNAGDWVSDWADQSGRGNHGLQPHSSETPRLVRDAANGLPVVRFDGADTVRFTNRLTDVRTVFWVVAESTAATSAYRSLLGDDTTTHFAGNIGAPGAIWRAGDAASAVVNGRLYLNGAPVDGLVTPRPRTLSVLSLVTTGDAIAGKFGQGFLTPWQGDLAELIVYDRALSAEERGAVEDYLVAKYRIGDLVAPPRFDPPGGTFTGSVEVRVTTATPGAEIFYTTDGSEPTQDATPYTGPVLVSATSTLKAKAWSGSLAPSVTTTASFTRDDDFHPGTVAGARLWWRADAGVPTGSGELWIDQSGNGNHGYQPAGTAVPRIVPNAVNGLPVMRFDGGDTVRFTTPLTTVRTVFWVVAESSTAPSAYRSLLGDDTTTHFAGNVGAPGAIWRAGDASPAVVNGRLYVNGSPVDGLVTPRPRTVSVLSLVTTANVSASKFGEGFLSPWLGDLAELVVYDRALTAEERSAVEDYLVAKYRIGDLVTPPRITPPGGRLSGPSVEVAMSTATRDAAIFYTLDGTEPTVASTPYTEPVEVSTTRTVKAKAFKAPLADSVTATAGFTRDGLPDDPAGYPGLQLWLRSDAGVPTGTGELWSDLSGQANHCFQTAGVAVSRLVPNALNGLPVMRFDGGDTVRFTNRITGVRTVFWVVREMPGTPSAYRSLLGDDTTTHFAGNVGAPGAIWRVGDSAAQVTGGSLRLNGTAVVGTATARPTQMSILSLVALPGGNLAAQKFGEGFVSPWNGDLAELIVYDAELTAQQVQSVERYLAARYGIALPIQ